MDDYIARFGGIGRLVGISATEILQRAHVCVIGIGGVGSWAAEALARTGIGEITLVDLDDVCLSNANRQIHALDGNVGKLKVEAMAERIQRINPECRVHPRAEFFTEKTIESVLSPSYDFVVDGIDNHKHKCRLIAGCRDRALKLVTCGGAGGRTDPTRVDLADLNQTYNDSLLYRVRKQLRNRHGFSRGREPWGVPCVYSHEHPVYPTPEGGVCEQPTPETSLRMDCATGYGAASFVTGTFGFVAASAVIRGLIEANDS